MTSKLPLTHRQKDYTDKIDILSETVDNSIQTVRGEMLQQFTDKLAEDCKRLEEMITSYGHKAQEEEEVMEEVKAMVSSWEGSGLDER